MSDSKFIRKVAKYNRRAGDFKRALFGKKGVTGAVRSVNELAKEVMGIKKTLSVKLNSETKRVRATNYAVPLGQSNHNLSGHLCVGITPLIAQGTTEETRVGNSLKMLKLRVHAQFRGQQNCLTGRKMKFHIVRVKNGTSTVTATQVMNNIWETNPLTGLFDYNCLRAYRSGKNDGMSIIKTANMYLSKAYIDPTGGSLESQERPIATYHVTVNMKDILRYENNTDTVPAGIEYFLVMVVDTGNAGNTFSTVGHVNNPLQFSGIDTNFAFEWHYVDN